MFSTRFSDYSHSLQIMFLHSLTVNLPAQPPWTLHAASNVAMVSLCCLLLNLKSSQPLLCYPVFQYSPNFLLFTHCSCHLPDAGCLRIVLSSQKTGSEKHSAATFSHLYRYRRDLTDVRASLKNQDKRLFRKA